MKKLIKKLQSAGEAGIDVAYSLIPRPEPSADVRKNIKIVSHRGAHDNRAVCENTLHAFDVALQHGLWGVEFDIRWTRDHQPIVAHDPTCERVFRRKILIQDVNFKELREQIPLIPSLEETLKKLAKKTHLMIEIKRSALNSRPEVRSRQIQSLRDLLSQLKPVEDFHILALHPEVFEEISFWPKQVFVAVSEINTRKLSDIAIEKSYGGFAGFYPFVTNRLLDLHHQKNQKVGTGFISSRNALYREINRGIDWIFTNHPVRIQKFVNER